MGIMIPDTIREGTVSSGERRLFSRFRRELPDSCIVLHSLGLTNHPEKIWGECDFVVLTPDGIFVLEVKSGGVSCRKGKWVYTDRTGTEFEKTEGPFEQAKGALFAVREKIEATPGLRGFLIGYGVIMPDEDFATEGPEIELGVLLGKNGFREKSLGDYIRQLSAFWHQTYLEKHGTAPKHPSKPDIETIRLILRPEVRTALTLNSTLDSLEQQQIELTEEQCSVLKCLDNNPRCVIEGGAGTGKTVLAVDKAIRLAKNGKRVLYLCFNRLLGDHVRETIRVGSGDFGGRLQAWSIHAYFNHTLDQLGRPRPAVEDGNGKEFFTEVYSSAYMDAVVDSDLEPFDFLVIDEGQDLLNESYLDAMDLTVKGGLDKGNWYLFLDPLQNIFHSETTGNLSELDSHGYARFRLTVNCRNTREVAVMTSIVSGIQLPLEKIIGGGRHEVIYYREGEDLVRELDKRVTKTLDGGVGRKDIIILSRYRLENSSLAGVKKIANSRINDLSAPADYKKTVDFCTIQGFKGLEKKVVFAIDVSDLLSEKSRYLHYCGLSRARTVLTVFIPEEEREGFTRLSYEFGKIIKA